MFHVFHPALTVSEHFAQGYWGLRIPRCPTCRTATWATWGKLEAEADEDLISIARRARCTECGNPPAGLAVVAIASDL